MKKSFFIGAAAILLALPLVAFAQTTGGQSGGQPKGGNKSNVGGSGKQKNKKPANNNKPMGAGMEKIPGPWAIGSYSDIQQSGNALWGKPKDKPPVTGSTNAAGLSCLSGVLETRDTAVMAAIATQNAADQASLSARKTCLETALAAAGSDVLNQLQACNKTYTDSRKTAAQASQTAAQTAQKQAMTDAQACVTNNSGTDFDAGKIVQALEEPSEIAKPQPLLEGNSSTTGSGGPQGGQGGGQQPPMQGGQGGQGGQGRQGGGQGGGQPPQAAVDACSSLSQGAICSFTDTVHGTVSGTCQTPPNMTQIVCVPAGGPQGQ